MVSADGIHLSNSDCHGNNIYFNDIAASATNGVLVDDDAHDDTIESNTSEDNAGAGIRIVNGTHNWITRNDINNNGGLGIDLAAEGVTLNDNDSMPPAPDYANRGQNFPMLDAARGGHHAGNVTFTLTSTPGDYTIELMVAPTCDSSGYGEKWFTSTIGTARPAW